MNILSKFTDFFGLSEEGDMEYEEEAVAPARTVQPNPQVTPKKKDTISEPQTSNQKAAPVQEEKVVSIHQNLF